MYFSRLALFPFDRILASVTSKCSVEVSNDGSPESWRVLKSPVEGVTQHQQKRKTASRT
jgi:hypothetical protein